MNHALDFYTAYHQFYISDKESIGNTASSKFWTDDSFNDRLAIEDGVLGVGTECYGPVKGELMVLDACPNDCNFDEYDHIVEAGIEIKSGVLHIVDCPTSNIQLEINVNPGTYRARIYSSNLISVEDDEGDDFYKIELWPDSIIERRVLKRYSN